MIEGGRAREEGEEEEKKEQEGREGRRGRKGQEAGREGMKQKKDHKLSHILVPVASSRRDRHGRRLGNSEQ